jgi:uncharacterized protein YceH (UPF0502 family)
MSEDSPAAAAPRWRPLERNERRVAGVLAEKAKTTPENYPLSINSLVNGCNQKSNRFPQMTLDEAQVQEALDSLRRAGAVALIQGDGRVEKFRHLLYDWLGVDKAELAVMTELLLRGAQTLGELRGRAARMEPIKDVAALQPIVDSLRQKDLLIYLTPAGRGGVVTHNLYQPQELEKLRSEHGGADASLAAARTDVPPALEAPGSAGGRRVDAAPAARVAVSPSSVAESDDLQDLRDEIVSIKRELAELREQSDANVADLRREVEDLKSQRGM